MSHPQLLSAGGPFTDLHPMTTDPSRLRPPAGALERKNGSSPPSISPTHEESGGILRERPGQPSLLPSEKVYPIQIGSELFRLSGASITSDGPSYFTRFFESQTLQDGNDGGVKTLYIDRDPAIFHEIARHLQGYYVQPADGSHYVRLFADAQFYSLPRLISQLFKSETFIQIGDRHFQVHKDIFSSPGDSPNFFTLGFAAFFSSSEEVFPGLDSTGLLRPPSIEPPSVPFKSAEVFAQLLHLLRGYPVHIRNEEHRNELLRDARYFHLRGLEQKLIPYEISYNVDMDVSEITISLHEVKPLGMTYIWPVAESSHRPPPRTSGWVYYARPFADEKAHVLILQISGEKTILNFNAGLASFDAVTEAKLFQLLENLHRYLHGPEESIWPKMRFDIPATADVTLDGKVIDSVSNVAQVSEYADVPSETKKRKLDDRGEADVREWHVRTGLWRLKLPFINQLKQQQQPLHVRLSAVKIEATTNERARNARRRFLG